MEILSDFHLHSVHSADGKATMESMIKQGIALSLKQICMTEHMDFFYIDESGNSSDTFTVDMPAYISEYKHLAKQYKQQIAVLFGIELGLASEVLEENNSFIESYPFDFVIGSLHICNGEDPYFPSFFHNRSDKEGYEEYFLCLLENIKLFSNFDVCGHLDYIVRYGKTKNIKYRFQDYSDIIDEILRYLIQNGKGIECNTGSLSPKYQLGETNPSIEILKRYNELGGEIITIGSDAHLAANMCYGFDHAYKNLKTAGFRYYTVYEKRNPSFVLLD